MKLKLTGRCLWVNKKDNGLFIAVDNWGLFNMRMIKKLYPKNWVRHYRKKNGMTAQELGRRIGMTKEGITKIERREGGLSIDNAKKIAAALQVHYINIIDGPGADMLADDEEKRLLEIFRILDEPDQIRLLGYAEAKADKK